MFPLSMQNSAFFPCLWLSCDKPSSNSRVLKEFFNSNLLVLIYFSRLMIRIIMLLAKRSISINLIQSFLFFHHIQCPWQLASSESEVPLVLQFYSFIYRKWTPMSFRNNVLYPLRKYGYTDMNDSDVKPLHFALQIEILFLVS